jgi:hypothetical protein
MNNKFEFRANGSSEGSDTSEMALGQASWAPQAAPLEVPRQILERRSTTPAWLGLVGRTTPRNA